MGSLAQFVYKIIHALGLGAHDHLAFLVLSLLLAQSFVLALLLFYVFYKRLKRLMSRRNNELREDKIRKAIIDHYFESATESSAEKNKRINSLRKENRGFVRRILLSTAIRFPSDGRTLLVDLYRELGYLRKDLKLLKSWLWWKRLEAVIRIEGMRLPHILDFLMERMEDSNELVSVAAMRALSVLHFPGKVEKILDALSRRAPYRKDIFIDVLNNLGHDHVDDVIRYLVNCYDPYIASICISVLGNLRVDRAHDVFLNFVNSSDDEVVRESVVALSKIRKTEGAAEAIREMLKHSSSSVRAAAVEALTRMQDLDAIPLIQRLENDEDVEVRRSVFYSTRLGGM